MLEVNLSFDNINITNIFLSDLDEIQKQKEYDKQFSMDILGERFLESYLSECEYFLKITTNDKLIGFIKGRLEFKNPNEAWVWFYHIDCGNGGDKLADEVVKRLFCYFNQEYCVTRFYIRVQLDDKETIKFWENMGFKPVRMVKDFYCIDDHKADMLVLENRNIKFGLQ